MGRRKTRNLKSKPKKNQIQIDKLVEELIKKENQDDGKQQEK